MTYGAYPGGHIVEFWTEAEFAALESWERPDPKQVAWFPGVGHVYRKPIESEEEYDEVYAEYCDAWQQGDAKRELMEL